MAKNKETFTTRHKAWILTKKIQKRPSIRKRYLYTGPQRHRASHTHRASNSPANCGIHSITYCTMIYYTREVKCIFLERLFSALKTNFRVVLYAKPCGTTSNDFCLVRHGTNITKPDLNLVQLNSSTRLEFLKRDRIRFDIGIIR